MDNYLANVRRFEVGLQVGKIPNDILIWLNHGFKKHTSTGEPLDECLGLKRGKGIRRIHTQALREERDRCIRGIANQYDGVPYAKALFVQKISNKFYGMSALNIIIRNRESGSKEYNGLVMFYMQSLSHIKYSVPNSISALLRIIDP